MHFDIDRFESFMLSTDRHTPLHCMLHPVLPLRVVTKSELSQIAPTSSHPPSLRSPLAYSVNTIFTDAVIVYLEHDVYCTTPSVLSLAVRLRASSSENA